MRCVCTPREYRRPWKPWQAFSFPRVGASGSRESAGVGPQNQARSYGRTLGTLNHWTISLASLFCETGSHTEIQLSLERASNSQQSSCLCPSQSWHHRQELPWPVRGVLWLFLMIFETGSQNVQQTGPKFTILMAPPPKCWDYRCVSSCLTWKLLL